MEFAKFSPLVLDDFQKKAITSIFHKRNILVCCHTGSGKTLCAEYAILKSLEQGKKIIYTSPIKSLSNQKFYDFKQKWGNQVGLITGDIKFNPFGSILIMTTEILRNKLLVSNPSQEVQDFTLEEVDTVIFDEIHYINDYKRGKVWEQCLIQLPLSIQLVLLSATIDKPESFGDWLREIRKKELDVISSSKRNVPLYHYTYVAGELFPLSTPENSWSPPVLEVKNSKQDVKKDVKSLKKSAPKEKVWNEVSYLNTLVSFLQKKELTPALFFVFSRKRCHEYAKRISSCLLNPEEMSNVKHIIHYQLHQTTHYHDIVCLEQFQELEKLLMKGIAIHHSGLLPILKELIERLFSKKLVKIIFATETFAVGVNMPTKTVLFTDLYKWSESATLEGERMMYPHEYIQMAGRAGRRGMDVKGIVIHLVEMYHPFAEYELKQLIQGIPQAIHSKFGIDYSMRLTFSEIASISSKSLLQREVNGFILDLEQQQIEYKKWLDAHDFIQEDEEMKEYFSLGFHKNGKAIQRRRKELEKGENFKERKKLWEECIGKQNKYHQLAQHIQCQKEYFETDIHSITKILIETNYLTLEGKKTLKGETASLVSEVNPILLTEFYEMRQEWRNKKIEPIAFLLAGFLESRSTEEYETLIDPIFEKLKIRAKLFENLEISYDLHLNVDWNIYTELCFPTFEWVCGTSFSEIMTECQMVEGNFITSMIKLNGICETLKRIAEKRQDIDIVEKMSQIQEKVMRQVVNVESLYI